MNISSADWARDYHLLYLYAMRQARMSYRMMRAIPDKRWHAGATVEWRREACRYLAKQHQHIMAQEASKKGR